MKKVILTFLISFVNFLYSQTIVGSILGIENKKCHVIIKDINNKIIADVLCQNNNFEYNGIIDPGLYTLEVYDTSKFIGEEKLRIENKVNKIVIDLYNYKELEELVIPANKYIELKGDRLVYSLNSSPFKTGFNSFEILKKIPFVLATDDKVTVIGKGDIIFTINDKRVNYSEQDLIEYLRTIPSENIEKIEVITTPPSKYDSYGNGGVINIKLKKQKDELGLIFSTSYIQRTNPNYSNNLNLNYSKNKISINVNVNDLQNNLTNNYRYNLYDSSNFLKQNSKEKINIDNNKLSSNLNFNYKLNKKIDLGILYDFYTTKTNSYTQKKIFVLNNNAIEDNLEYNNKTRKNIVNLYSDIKIDTLGSKISLVGNYIYNKGNTSNLLENYSFNNKNELKNDLYSLQADLSLVGEKINSNTGFNLARLTSDIINKNEIGKNIFNYTEFISNLYYDVDIPVNAKLNIKGGIKYEHWERLINEIKVNNNYLFPNFNLLYKPNSKNILTFSYSKRLVKPYLSYLDPFEVYTSENSYYVGNPYLNAYTVNNIDFKYSYNYILFFNLYSNFNKNVFGTTTKFDENNFEKNTYENYYDSNTYGTSISYSYKKSSWFDSQLFYNLYYVDSNVNKEFISQNGFVNIFYLDSNFYLTKDKSTSLSVSYFLSLPYKAINNENKTLASFNIGFKTNLIKDLLSLNVSTMDIFRQQGEKRTTFFSNGDKQSHYKYNDLRRISVTLSYKIGKKKNSKNINNNDRIENPNNL